MNYQNIRRFLGEDWLKRQLRMIENKEWVVPSLRNQAISQPGYYVLEYIDKLLLKFKDIEGFNDWVRDSKNERDFENYLFELMVLENLQAKNSILKLKPENNDKVPEAVIQNGRNTFYVEMTKLRSAPESIQNKVEKLFEKARKKFKGHQGIHFIGVYDFFKPEGENENPLPELKQLSDRIKLKFHYRKNENILAFVLVHMYVTTTPDFQKSSIQKRYRIIAKPIDKFGKPFNFFEDIFKVDGFIEE